jgi:hypothetical protein
LRNLLRDDKDIVLIEVPFHVDDNISQLIEEETPISGDSTNGDEIIETLIMMNADEQKNDQDNPERIKGTTKQDLKDDLSSSDNDSIELKD